MLSRSMSFAVCFSLFISGNVLVIGKGTKIKKVVQANILEKEKQNNKSSLGEKIQSNEKLIVQIQELTEKMDKDAAANMAIKSWQEQLYLLNDEIKKELQPLWDKVAANPQVELTLLGQWVLDVFIKTSKMSAAIYSQESLRGELCISVISQEARMEFYGVFIENYILYIADHIKSVSENIQITSLKKLEEELTERLIFVANEAARFAAQVMAEKLSKYYKIDFEFLGLNAPEKVKINTTEKK